MSTELWYPIPSYVPKLSMDGKITTVEMLCKANRVPCRFQGRGAQRSVSIVQSSTPFIQCVPHQGDVRIGTKHSPKSKSAQKYALAALAYAVFDLAARESIYGIPEFHQIRVVGRPRSGRIKTNAERQKIWREKKR